jgi:hypothetical protein
MACVKAIEGSPIWDAGPCEAPFPGPRILLGLTITL